MAKTNNRAHAKFRLEAVEVMAEAYMLSLDLEKLQKQLSRYKEPGEIWHEQDESDPSSEGKLATISAAMQEKFLKLQSLIDKLNTLPHIYVSEFSILCTSKNVEDLEEYFDEVVKYVEANRKQWMKATSEEGFKELTLKEDIDVEIDSEFHEQRPELPSVETISDRVDQLEKHLDLFMKNRARIKELEFAVIRNNEMIAIETSDCTARMSALVSLQNRIQTLEASHEYDCQRLSSVTEKVKCGRTQAANWQLTENIVKREVSKLTEDALEPLQREAQGRDSLFDEVWQKMVPVLQIIRSADKWNRMGNGTVQY